MLWPSGMGSKQTWGEYGRKTGRVHPWWMRREIKGGRPPGLYDAEYLCTDGNVGDAVTLDEIDLSQGYIEGYRIPHRTDHRIQEPAGALFRWREGLKD